MLNRAGWAARPASRNRSGNRERERGVELGQLARAGSGSRGNAFRYTLPGTDFDWDVDPYELLGV
jgi:hypothetical protein